jgi:hypothetical protein
MTVLMWSIAHVLVQQQQRRGVLSTERGLLPGVAVAWSAAPAWRAAKARRAPASPGWGAARARPDRP